METPAIPVTQSEPEEVPETVKISAIPANQSETEDVPETVEILPLQLIRVHQRRSKRPWRPCHCS